MNSIMERWTGSCRRELLDRTLVWNQRHLMTVLREYESFYNTHRPHRTLARRRTSGREVQCTLEVVLGQAAEPVTLGVAGAGAAPPRSLP